MSGSDGYMLIAEALTIERQRETAHRETDTEADRGRDREAQRERRRQTNRQKKRDIDKNRDRQRQRDSLLLRWFLMEVSETERIISLYDGCMLIAEPLTGRTKRVLLAIRNKIGSFQFTSWPSFLLWSTDMSLFYGASHCTASGTRTKSDSERTLGSQVCSL